LGRFSEMKAATGYADFNNADPNGRLRLNCVGTVEDLSKQKVELADGLKLLLYDDELEADGIVEYSQEENGWVAVIDWKAIRRFDEASTQDVTDLQ